MLNIRNRDLINLNDIEIENEILILKLDIS